MVATTLRALAVVLLVIALGRAAFSPLMGPTGTKDTNTTVTAGLGRPGGNLVVTVPPVPPKGALHKLCVAFLAQPHHSGFLDPSIADGRKPESVLIQELIQATGGSPAATTAWCDSYLHRRSGSNGHKAPR
jgi:hypothetical protein